MNPSALLRLVLLACAAGSACADSGKLRLTGGVTSIDGAAGGGLSPWALIGTQATQGERGASLVATVARTRDFGLDVIGAAFAHDDRIELTLARQRFDTGPTGAALGQPGLHLKLDIVGAKLRLGGDAVLDADTPWPQVAVGVLHKRVDADGLAPTLAALGATRSGTDVYLSASKLLLAQGLLVNATLRATRANENGLLGFGSSRSRRHRVMPELSLAWLLRRDLALGAEWRAKPDNLNHVLGPGVLKEDDWADVFVSWAPSKNVSVTAAWLDLGRITPPFVTRRQTGAYLSLQVAL
jgi:Protein of unknown function (DUF3034)